jgi:hypothetical protein
MRIRNRNVILGRVVIGGDKKSVCPPTGGMPAISALRLGAGKLVAAAAGSAFRTCMMWVVFLKVRPTQRLDKVSVVVESSEAVESIT